MAVNWPMLSFPPINLWSAPRRKDIVNTDKVIRYSVERLYHFSCDTCHKWFSIGDWTETESIVCPFCGIEHKVEEMK